MDGVRVWRQVRIRRLLHGDTGGDVEEGEEDEAPLPPDLVNAMLLDR
jgi:hypothetical protein